MHPFRELPRRRPRARLLGMHVPLRRGRRGPACLQEYSPRQLAAVIGVALAAGAALEFFLDPRSGKRRRHLARDRTRAALRRRAHGRAPGPLRGGQDGRGRARDHAPSARHTRARRRQPCPQGRERAVPRSHNSQGADQHQRRPRDRGPPRAARRCLANPAHRARGPRGGGRSRGGEPAPPAGSPGRRQAVHTATRARRPGTCRPRIREDDELDLERGTATCLDVPFALATIRSTAATALALGSPVPCQRSIRDDIPRDGHRN